MTASPAPAVSTPRLPGAAAAAAVIWLVLAVIAAASGFLVRLPFPGAQVIILSLVAITLAAAFASSGLRSWIDSIPLRVLVGVNAIRFVGIAFLVVAAQGQLNPVFAGRAGWGDIAVATAALILAWAGTPRLLTLLWNSLGVLDLVVAVGTATAVTVSGTTPGVTALLTLPLSLIPTFFVPLFLANHVFIFRRLLAPPRGC
jgi:hypothetical protein